MVSFLFSWAYLADGNLLCGNFRQLNLRTSIWGWFWIARVACGKAAIKSKRQRHFINASLIITNYCPLFPGHFARQALVARCLVRQLLKLEAPRIVVCQLPFDMPCK